MIDIYDVVTKLIGPINPVGETELDSQRLDNLKKMTSLVDKLVYDIGGVVPNKDRVEYSRKIIGECADKFLTGLGIKE